MGQTDCRIAALLNTVNVPSEVGDTTSLVNGFKPPNSTASTFCGFVVDTTIRKSATNRGNGVRA